MDIQIHDQEYSRLLWDIHSMPHDLDLRKYVGKEFEIVFPNLIRAARDTCNKMARYVIFMYDKETPLRKYYRQISERRQKAAKLSGYSHGNIGKAKKDSILDGTDPVLIKSVFNFVRYQNDPLFASLVTNEINFWQYQRELTSPSLGSSKDDEKTKLQNLELKSKLMKESEIIRQRMSEFEDELFGGDKEMIDNVRDLRRTSGTSPEQIAS